jgi:hypothetical protein
VWHPRTRLVGAFAIAGGGVALCLALDHYWWSRQPLPRGLANYPPLRVAGASASFGSVAGDLLLVALPFYALAVIAALTHIRALAATVGVAAIALLTIFEYRRANTTDSSTAALAFVGAIQVGVPIAFAVWGLDRLAARMSRSSLFGRHS